MDTSKLTRIKMRAQTRAATVLALAGLFSSGLFWGAGCWFSRGKEGFVCKKNKDCRKGLYCRTFVGKGQRRKQCRPWGKRTISSKSGYTIYAVYMTYIFWIALPIVIAVLIVRARLKKKKGGTTPPAAGTSPPPPRAESDPPPPPAGTSSPPPPAEGGPPAGSA